MNPCNKSKPELSSLLSATELLPLLHRHMNRPHWLNIIKTLTFTHHSIIRLIFCWKWSLLTFAKTNLQWLKIRDKQEINVYLFTRILTCNVQLTNIIFSVLLNTCLTWSHLTCTLVPEQDWTRECSTIARNEISSQSAYFIHDFTPASTSGVYLNSSKQHFTNLHLIKTTYPSAHKCSPVTTLPPTQSVSQPYTQLKACQRKELSFITESLPHFNTLSESLEPQTHRTDVVSPGKSSPVLSCPLNQPSAVVSVFSHAVAVCYAKPISSNTLLGDSSSCKQKQRSSN